MSKNSRIKSACKAAEESTLRFKVGSVIVNAGRIISSGCNERRYTKHVRGRRHAQSLCSEQAAIVKLLTARRQDELVGASLYVTRINTQGVAMAKPCPFCQELIRSVGIRKVFYTDEDQKVVEYRP